MDDLDRTSNEYLIDPGFNREWDALEDEYSQIQKQIESQDCKEMIPEPVKAVRKIAVL
ncbi:MAG: hypothetical protein IKR28_06540 [Selenomonadaceae bacterium]|nr:hypothetical protein [Selenomonadaceae bacterium]